MSDAILMAAKGQNGTLLLLADRIRISRTGVMAKLQHGAAGDKDILIRQIASIQYKNAGLTTGYIQFAFLGGQEAKKGVLQAQNDENTITFQKKHQPEFDALKAALEAKMSEAHAAPTAAVVPDPLADLERLAGLRDRDIITEEEFAAKKRGLLGL